MLDGAPFTVDEAAALLRCSPKTVQEHVRTGRLAGVKFGEDWVFPRGAFFARLDELALEEARERRQPGKPLGTLHSIKQAPARGNTRARQRALPVLPAV